MELVVPLRIKKVGKEGFLATSPFVPGLVAQGRTVTETAEIAQDVAKKIIESYLEHHDPIPPRLRKLLRNGRKNTEIQIPVAVNF